MRFAIVAGVMAALLGVGSAAHAQVPPLPGIPPALPPTPSLPNLPKPVTDAVNTVEETAYPYLLTAAFAAAPAVEPVGFALRPECGTLGYAAFVLAVAGPSIPISYFGVTSPAFVLCGSAWADGPADPYFKQVDKAAGPTLGSEWRSAAKTIHNSMDPVRSDVEPLCGVIAFTPPTADFPPPAERFRLEDVVC
jgi:hypothetical protein